MNPIKFRQAARYLIVGLIASSLTSICSAAMFSFERITSNNIENVASQFAVDVSDSGGQVLFKFSNVGPLASNVARLYWDDDLSLLSNAPVDVPEIDAGTTSAGVNFEQGPEANPSNVPSGNTVGFFADYSIESANGPPTNGVNPGEMIGILFDGDANAVISAMQSGNLRMGVHVRSIGSAGNSDAFVSVGVPEPTAWMLLAIGLGALSLRCKRSC